MSPAERFAAMPNEQQVKIDNVAREWALRGHEAALIVFNAEFPTAVRWETLALADIIGHRVSVIS